MSNSDGTRNPRSLIIICVALFALAALPLLSRAQPATSVNIVNNSNKEIRNVYLSHVDVDDWGTNQLSDTTISPGQSFTITNFTCDQNRLR